MFQIRSLSRRETGGGGPEGALLRWTWLVACASWLCTQPTHANGRLPGATELAINRSNPDHLIARATFGMVQTFDEGETWQWICERAVNVSGEADPPVAVTEDNSIVLLPPARGTLISRDRGCSWESAPPPLHDSRGVDLTVDPHEPARVLVMLSSVDTIDDTGVVSYENVLMETRDNARTWSEVGRLPSMFFAETVEIAASDANRIYVAGTSNMNPLLGVVQRSEDGGKTWSESQVGLPAGSGSMFISAIDPTDPDRLWVRLPAKGDRFGTMPVTLIMSHDGGESWEMIAATANQAMLGFALSPDGKRLAYGGPADGLFIGSSDGRDGFTKVSDLRVRCLRWNGSDLYACGTEALGSQQAGDPFSVGVSSDEGATFRPVYKIAQTCPQECADGGAFALTCMAPWSALAPVLRFEGETCSVPWARAAQVDAGLAPVSEADASTVDADVRVESAPMAAANGCSVVGRSDREPRWLMLLAFGLLLLATRRKHWLGLVCIGGVLVAFGCSDEEPDGESLDETAAATFVACPASIPELEPGVSFEGRHAAMRAEVLAATPMPARKFRNDWTIAIRDSAGEPLDDVEITRLEAFMPVHQHYSRPPAEVERLAEPGELHATIHFTMRGPWEAQVEASSASAGDDYIVIDVCVEE